MQVRTFKTSALPLALLLLGLVLGCSPGPVTNCPELCERWTGTTAEESECIIANLEMWGFALADTPECQSVGSAQRCNGCIAALGLKDEECVTLYTNCMAGESRVEAAGQAGEGG